MPILSPLNLLQDEPEARVRAAVIAATDLNRDPRFLEWAHSWLKGQSDRKATEAFMVNVATYSCEALSPEVDFAALSAWSAANSAVRAVWELSLFVDEVDIDLLDGFNSVNRSIRYLTAGPFYLWMSRFGSLETLLRQLG